MNVPSLLFGALIVVVLLGAAVYFGWRQGRTAQLVRLNHDMPIEEREFLRRQVRRRMICSVLMVLLAILLAGWFAIESSAPEHLPNNPEETPRENPWVNLMVYYVTFLLLVLFSLLAMAGIDLAATARFGFRTQRKLASEHRAILEAEIARLRQDRQTRNGD